MIHSIKKLEIGKEVSFDGHIVGADGVRPDPVRLDAISNFPTPTDVTSFRSFLGVANQLGTYLPDLASASTKLHVLLGKNVSWVWNPEHDNKFKDFKNLLNSTTIVKLFDTSLRSVILTDASAAGIGFALVQYSPDGAPRLISCGSRSLNPAEKRYSPEELEAIRAVFAIQKCSFYMLGSPTTFTLITDHQLLSGFFQRPLNECTNSHLLRMRLKVIGANVRLEWQAGKHNLIADAISRFPVSPKEPMDSAEMEEDRAFNRRTITSNDGGLEWLCGRRGSHLQGGGKSLMQRLLCQPPAHRPPRPCVPERLGFHPRGGRNWISTSHLLWHSHYSATLSPFPCPRSPPHSPRRPGQDEESRPAAILLAGDECCHPRQSRRL